MNRMSNVKHWKISKFLNIHRNKRCFIVGNGPSLRIGDLDLLGNEITFAANKIYLAFSQTSWRPSYYFVIDRLVLENNQSAINDLSLPTFMPDLFYDIFDNRPNVIYFKALRGQRFDVTEGLDCGSTVIAPMLQMAYYMGIREIYLIGLDFHFIVPPKSGSKTNEKDEILISQGERNHFHAGYRLPGEKWTYPKLDLQHQFFAEFLDFTWRHNERHIVFNASRHTRLNVFPRVNFSELVGEGRAESGDSSL